ncbi:MAG: HAD hydrolase-like protein [Candidatus Moraniibacteriota bacterium]
MKLFIDFDDVLFNAKKFKTDLINIFIKNGVSKLEFENSYYSFRKKDQALGKYYDLKKQISALKKIKRLNHEKLANELADFTANLESYVFSDVKIFLEKFPKKDLFLITYGHEKFQKLKIKNSDLKKYFSQIIITKNYKADDIKEVSEKLELSLEEKIILIDDRPEQIEIAKKKNKKIITLRLRRKEGRYKNLICKNTDYEIKNLKEALKIINNLK